jgi:phage-related protein
VLAIFSALAGPILAVVTAVTFLISPIGAAIAIVALLVAGLIYAYKHSATFRGIVLKLWAAFRVGVAIIKKDVIPVIVHFWHNVMVPAFRAIGRAIAWAWDHVIKPTFKALWWYISKVLAPVIKWLWQHIIVPAFKGIWKIISFAWNNVIKPMLQGALVVHLQDPCADHPVPVEQGRQAGLHLDRQQDP